MGVKKVIKLTNKKLIKKYKLTEVTAEDVMEITGVTSKATALKRMNCKDEESMLALKGSKQGYEYSQEHMARRRRDYHLDMFSNKEKKEKFIQENRPYYDKWFRLALAKI